MAPNHGGYPLGSLLGPVGSHWVKKWVKTVENYHAPKFEFSFTPRTSIFSKKWKLRLWRQITVGTRQSPSWGQWGPIGSKKWVKTVKNYHAPEFELSIIVIVFLQKMEVTVMAPNHGGDPLGSILGPMGSHWVKNEKNYHAPKFEFSITPRSSIFPKKWKLRLWRQIYGGDPLGSILRLVRYNWVQKMCQTAKKLPCPKIRIFDYPTVIGFSQKKWNWRLWRQITVGTP